MPILSDTARMNWLVSKGCVEVEAVYLGPTHVISGSDKLGSGRDLRAAIDAAMKRERRERQSSPKAPQMDAQARADWRAR